MAVREVSLFLKYPGNALALQRLQHSFLECVVEYKSGTEVELQTRTPNELKSDYQVKGTATLVDDEILIQFLPKNAGLHTVRIFADTRELCRPVAFIINRSCEVESTPIDKPVKVTSSLFQHPGAPSPVPSTTQSLPHVQQQMYNTQRQRLFPSASVQMGQTGGDGLVYPSSMQATQQAGSSGGGVPGAFDENMIRGRGFTSDPSLLPAVRQSQYQFPSPVDPQTSGDGTLADPQSNANQRFSYVSSAGGARPTSMVPDDPSFAGDLFSMTPEQSSFDQLYHTKSTGGTVYGNRKPFLAVDHDKVMTPETFQNLKKDINLVVHHNEMKAKKRCAICSKKVKLSKAVVLGEEQYCEPCFRRQYLLRTAIDHFMVPSIRECAVEVPVNKKGTKFITARKTIANVNLRGLEPSEVRYAQDQFRRFDMEGSGWIDKALLLPLMRSCFTYSMNDRQIKQLLSSPSLQSMVKSFGIEERDEVHELEFLSLLAFVAREALRLRGAANLGTTRGANKFTANDLEMAYAFRNQFGPGNSSRSVPQGMQPQPPRPPPPSQQTGSKQMTKQQQQRLQQYRQSQMRQSQIQQQSMRGYTGVGQFQQPPMTQSVNPATVQHYTLNTSPQHISQGGGGNHTSQIPTSPTDASLNSSSLDPRLPNASMQFGMSPNQRGQSQSLSPSRGQMQNPVAGFRSHVPSQYDDFSNIHGPRAQRVGSMNVSGGSGGQLDTSRNTIGFSAELGNTHLLPLRGPADIGELPEEDQDEVELPTLPPEKDPSGQTITNALLNKRQPNPKQMMEDLKLTGGSADSWMLY